MPLTPEQTEPVLDREAIAAVDPTDQLTDVLALPEHVRDALWKTDSAGLGSWDSPGGLIVAGMGASALGGPLARAALGDHASRPVFSARAYGLPPWTTPDTTVLCASYSGDTEETLACFEVAAACGAGPHLTSELDVAAEHLEELVVEWGPEGAEDNEVKVLARALQDVVPVIVGAGITTPVAHRWKGQINRLARVPAFASELPEADHHEIAGWENAQDLGRFSAVFLDDSDLHPRVLARIALTREIVETHTAGTHVLTSRGQTAVERVLSLVLAGDLVALYLGVLRGIDPAAPSCVDQLKGDLQG